MKIEEILTRLKYYADELRQGIRGRDLFITAMSQKQKKEVKNHIGPESLSSGIIHYFLETNDRHDSGNIKIMDLLK